MSSLAGRILHRAAEVLDAVDFAPAAVRAGLVHDNERRWRLFHDRIAMITEGR